MGRRHSIAEARSNLPALVREAEAVNAVELTRRGEGVAVLIGRKRYEQLMSRPRAFSEAWDDFSASVDLEQLAIDPDEVFARTRDHTPGRDADL